MATGGGEVGIAEAPEHAELSIVGRHAKQELVRGLRLAGVARTAVEEEGGGAEGFSPQASGHGCVHQQSTHAVVESAQSTLRFAILLTGVWTGEAKMCAMTSKK